MNVSFDQMNAVDDDGRALRFLHMGDPGHPNRGCGGCVFYSPVYGGCCHACERDCLGFERKDKQSGGIWILA